MKRYRVTLYVGDDKQWMFVYANSKDEAISNAKDSISVLSVEEVSETGL